MQNKVTLIHKIMKNWAPHRFRMRNSFISTLILCLCLLMNPIVWAQNKLEAQVVAYRSTVKTLGDALRTELMKAIKEVGPLKALEVCRIQAPQISQETAKQSGFKVARTSLKVRNQAHVPDLWEEKVLKSFEKRRAQGEDPQSLEYYEMIEHAGQRQIRYMKAIPTAELCLTCHGNSVAPEIQSQLKILYPQDQATGFKVGDLRGAFTLTETLTSP